LPDSVFILYETGLLFGNLLIPFYALKNKFDPRNIAGMPVVKFIFRLELEEIFIL